MIPKALVTRVVAPILLDANKMATWTVGNELPWDTDHIIVQMSIIGDVVEVYSRLKTGSETEKQLIGQLGGIFGFRFTIPMAQVRMIESCMPLAAWEGLRQDANTVMAESEILEDDEGDDEDDEDEEEEIEDGEIPAPAPPTFAAPAAPSAPFFPSSATLAAAQGQAPLPTPPPNGQSGPTP